MPRLKPVKPRTLKRVLRHNELARCAGRGKGSHEWHAHPEDPTKHTTVPDYDEISVHLLRVILQQVGKTRDDYFRALDRVR